MGGEALERAARGAAGGVAATVALSAFRSSLTKAGVVHKTAPMQVVERLTETGFASEWSPAAKGLLTTGAHFGYGVGAGAAFGALRNERRGYATEASVGAALGVLIWGMGWAGWLPLLGVHRAPWNEDSSNAVLPILDHAFFGAVWGMANRAFRGGES